MDRQKAVLIGYGRWGKILSSYIRKYFDLELIYTSKHKGPGFTHDLMEILDHPASIVFIATPIDTHYHLVKEFLYIGKHVFCEKPLTQTKEKAIFLMNLAEQQKVTLFTDYTYTFSPAIKKLKMIDFDYINLVIHRQATSDFDVKWLLLPHALSILNVIMPLHNIDFEMAGTTKSHKQLNLFYKKKHIGHIDVHSKKSNKTVFSYVENNGVVPIYPGIDCLEYAMTDFISALETKRSNINIAIEITATIETLYGGNE